MRTHDVYYTGEQHVTNPDMEVTSSKSCVQHIQVDELNGLKVWYGAVWQRSQRSAERELEMKGILDLFGSSMVDETQPKLVTSTNY